MADATPSAPHRKRFYRFLLKLASGAADAVKAFIQDELDWMDEFERKVARELVRDEEPKG
jgi:hypothetical protein